MFAHLDVASGALATSGDYERYLVVDGRRYCHIMDPRTGWPVAAWQSVSVVAPLAVAAGACTTIAMLHDVEPGLEFLNAQGVRYLAVDATGHRHAS
jgi:thiamine biosynthesis lipoprotein